jgi:hypothetical protein
MCFDELLMIIYGGQREIVIIEDFDSDGRIAIAVESLVGFYQCEESAGVFLDVSSADGAVIQIQTKNSMGDIHELLKSI